MFSLAGARVLIGVGEVRIQSPGPARQLPAAAPAAGASVSRDPQALLRAAARGAAAARRVPASIPLGPGLYSLGWHHSARTCGISEATHMLNIGGVGQPRSERIGGRPRS